MRRVYDPATPVEPAFTYRESRGVVMTVDPPPPVFPPGSTLAVDIETVGTNELAFYVKVIQIGTATHVVAFDPRDPRQLANARRTIAEAGRLVFHNSPFDVPPLVHIGAMTYDDIGKVYDTLILARMAETTNMGVDRSLSGCAKRYLGIEIESDISAAFKAAGFPTKAAGYAEMDIDAPVYLMSAMLDTAFTAAFAAPLYDAVVRRMTDNPFSEKQALDPHRVIEREQIVNRVMLRRSAFGIPVDLDYLDSHRLDSERERHRVEAELTELGIRPGNGNDLTTWLADRGELPADWPRTKTGKPSAAAAHLEELSHPIAAKFVWHKQLERIDTYLGQVELYARMTGKLHPQVGICGATATGRMAYGGGVPLQQFSAAARGILLAEPGRQLVSIDWSSIEPILAANCSGQQSAISLYESGGDLYAPAVEAAGVTRKVAKTVLLAQLYGQGIESLSKRIGRTEDEATQVRNAIMGQYPEIRRLLVQLKSIGNDIGRIPTISGRILDAPKIRGQFAGYKCQNYFHQGSAYDVLAETIALLDREGASHTIVLGMHDELVIEADPALRGDDVRFIESVMQTPPDDLCRWANRVPVLRTDVETLGERWSKPE